MTKILAPSALEYINSLLSNHQGIGLADDHQETADKQWLAKNLFSINADILFLEQNRQQTIDGKSVDAQAVVDQFLKTSHDNNVRNQLRKCVQNFHHGDEGDAYFSLIESAAQCGKHIVFINQRGEIKARNDFMEKITREHTANGESYLILVGKGHLGKFGIGDSQGSLSKRLGIPALEFAGHFTPAANNPEIPLDPFCVFQSPGSNYDGCINLFPYQPTQRIVHSSLSAIEQDAPELTPTSKGQVSMFAARAGQYTSAQDRIAELAATAAEMGASKSAGQLNGIAYRIGRVKKSDPLVPNRFR